MEIKATLNKPYSEEQRINFIVEQNHLFGYEIKETEEALEAWGYTEEEKAQQAKQNQIQILTEELEDVDSETIRPLRAVQSGEGTEQDFAKLAELESQAKELRRQIKELQGN